MDCTVTLPKNALSAAGLSSLWIVDGCDQVANPTFAECTIVDPVTGHLGVYSPLLVNAADKDKVVNPTVPQLPPNAVIGCWFGTNGATTTLKDTDNGATLQQANCVNGGPDGSIFGQFAACNAVQFFKTANPIANIPPLGFGFNGVPCYTTRSFQLIDMDPSDNVVTKYLVDKEKRKFAQATLENRKKFQQETGMNATELNNGSDNLLLDALYRPAVGCPPFTTTNLADPTGPPTGSLALNELQANRYQPANPAVIPPLDPMVVIDANHNTAKQSAYRVSVNQLPSIVDAATETSNFCLGMLTITAPALITDMKFTKGGRSPDPTVAIDLFTFLGQRFAASWTGLTCDKVLANRILGADGKPTSNPVTANFDPMVTTRCVSLTFNTATLVQLLAQNGGVTKTALALPEALPQYLAAGNANAAAGNTVNNGQQQQQQQQQVANNGQQQQVSNSLNGQQMQQKVTNNQQTTYNQFNAVVSVGNGVYRYRGNYFTFNNTTRTWTQVFPAPNGGFANPFQAGGFRDAVDDTPISEGVADALNAAAAAEASAATVARPIDAPQQAAVASAGMSVRMVLTIVVGCFFFIA